MEVEQLDKKAEILDKHIANFCSQINFGPVPRVRKAADVSKWQISKAYYELVAYINNTASLIQGMSVMDDYAVTPEMCNIMEIFDRLDCLIEANPPLLHEPDSDIDHIDFPSIQCYGNHAYRAWSRNMLREIFPLIEHAIPRNKCHYVNELGHYLSESFGNSTRIDYGTGHELSFAFFLVSLFRANILKRKDLKASVLLLFHRYLGFVRRLQRLYNMETAGSSGPYSLDDFQFLPYLWGAAQLCVGESFAPRQMLDTDILEEYKHDNLLVSCVAYTGDRKKGTYAAHSTQLWCIPALDSWDEVYYGLYDMYKRTVLHQFTVMQHANFGKLMVFDRVRIGTDLVPPRLGKLLEFNEDEPVAEKTVDDDFHYSRTPSLSEDESDVSEETEESEKTKASEKTEEVAADKSEDTEETNTEKTTKAEKTGKSKIFEKPKKRKKHRKLRSPEEDDKDPRAPPRKGANSDPMQMPTISTHRKRNRKPGVIPMSPITLAPDNVYCSPSFEMEHSVITTGTTSSDISGTSVQFRSMTKSHGRPTVYHAHRPHFNLPQTVARRTEVSVSPTHDGNTRSVELRFKSMLLVQEREESSDS
ncbi:serine/threonine-protein phosphatase 2A activator-like [Scaptodrosophila lebanonensis]|uniref:Serine/threonine-protein phosphatase 2A activator n=1 Tax=Drosophila lebanonensis TaxID=7225 RepID=A0A6J2TYV1_DROLE|nr:serine/threonine-protein phosphatase 2A activator-like [Scaptodrosophila lebanonensis]